jgi:hypothetical protein
MRRRASPLAATAPLGRSSVREEEIPQPPRLCLGLPPAAAGERKRVVVVGTGQGFRHCHRQREREQKPRNVFLPTPEPRVSFIQQVKPQPCSSKARRLGSNPHTTRTTPTP